jgi:hypothetical protein
MTSDLLDVTCPGCSRAFALPDADTETECPHCGRALAVDAEDHVTAEDEEADHELFTVDAEGELSAETFLPVTCPHCGCVHEAAEPEVTCCPRCRRLVPIDDQGRIDDGRGFHWDCPRCGSLLEGSCCAEDERCQACGWYNTIWEIFGPDEEEETGLFCPNCGDGIGLDEDRVFLRLQPNGRIRCQLCEWELSPPAGADLQALAETVEESVSSRPGFRGQTPNPHKKTLIVAADGSGDHRRIEDAVRAGGWGSSIRVRPGRYEEALVLLFPVEIVAEGPPGSVVLDGGEQTCVRIECGEVTLRGLSLTSRETAALVLQGQPLLAECSFHSSGRVGVLVAAAAARPMLCYCQIEGGQVGLQVEGRGLARLEECVVGGSEVSVELIDGGRFDAWSCRFRGPGDCQLSVRTGCQATLTECALTGSAAGVCVSGGVARLQRCRVHDCRGTGVFVQAGVAALEECQLDHNGSVGMAVRARGKAILSRCRLEDNRDNLLLSGRAVALIEDCELGSHDGVGLCVRGHARPHLCRCRVAGGDRALFLGSAAAARLEDCTLTEEARAGCEMASGSRIEWVRPGGS